VEAESPPTPVSRRDFLKFAGFTAVGAAFVGCERAPVKHAVPYLTQPAEILPGKSYYYASTCGGCSAGCGMLVKNRDGRPIKLEGNPDHPLSRGGLCAVGQASLLGLYDQQRLTGPKQGGQAAEWSAVDEAILQKLAAIREKKEGAVRVVTGSGLGPSTRASIRRFLSSFADGRHVVSDSRFCSAILEAHERTHGVRVLPHYRLEKAEVIVGLDADFLGTWISPVEFTSAYQAGRRLEGAATRMSYHVQFESMLSLTGSKADRRLSVEPGATAAIVNQLAVRLGKQAGTTFAASETLEKPASVPEQFLDHLANYLWQHRGRSLILSGSQDVDVQVVVNWLNNLLASYGSTVDIVQSSNQSDANDRDLESLLVELHQGKVAALFVYQANPAHDLPNSEEIVSDLKKVPLLVSLSPRLDETAQLAHFACPDHHELESWRDAEPVIGTVSLTQPTINPIGKTRSIVESLSAWLKQPSSAYSILRGYWEKEVFPRRLQGGTFDEFWDRTLHDGFAAVKPLPSKIGTFNATIVTPATVRVTPQPPNYSLLLYSKVGIPDASHAYNPWLHELPDPISKVTWDNYACISAATAAALGVGDGDVVRIEADGNGTPSTVLELPAYIQPGLHDRAVAVALGYGSVLSRRFAEIGPKWLQARPTGGVDGMVGKNGASFLRWIDRRLHTTLENVRLTKTRGKHQLACTQDFYQVTVPKHLALPGQEQRPIIRETTLAEHQSQPPKADNVAASEPNQDLWPNDHQVTGARWGMVIDLNACTGCSACIVACQAENNVPVVGQDEVRRHREMHWLRIDRYYAERDDAVNVSHQPMLCHHCGNAPCEVVCPVLATVHSEEGLNEQVYNRCVGTRYCANNCPYKVRRFNWFDYAHDDLLHNLVLNPDVTVRSRGVMEKCTFCVQRIQDAEIESGGHMRRVQDGIVQTACQQSCPAQAIVFGDLNDPRSRVARLAASGRSYQVLGELNIKPAVSYLTLVRNRPSGAEGEKRG
jgi:molybdopterin-containing oxidoreductase family iron-sulfur binding subunit